MENGGQFGRDPGDDEGQGSSGLGVRRFAGFAGQGFAGQGFAEQDAAGEDAAGEDASGEDAAGEPCDEWTDADSDYPGGATGAVEEESDFDGKLGLHKGGHMIRCGACHEVIELGELVGGRCPKCGCPYSPPKKISAPEGSFIARYAGEQAPGEAESERQMLKPRSGVPIVLIVGVAMIVIAVAGGGLVLAGVFNAKPTGTPHRTPNTVIGIATPEVTIPPVINTTLEYLADPQFSAIVSIDSSVMVSGRVSSRPGTVRSHLQVKMSSGVEAGQLTVGRTTWDCYVDQGTILVRQQPKGKWQGAAYGYLVLSPFFDLTDPDQLQLKAETTRNGIPVYHMTNSRYWKPDILRLAIMGSAVLDQFQIQGGQMMPDHYTLDLYVANNGAPVYAEYHAWVAAADGTKVLALDTYYTFTNVGLVEAIPSPSGL